MTVYEHKQQAKGKRQDGKPRAVYRAYRVARSVDGSLRQQYFPFTEKGKRDAEKLDNKWRKEALAIAKFFSGPAARWNPDKNVRK